MKLHKRYLSIICFMALMISIMSVILTKGTIAFADELWLFFP